MIVDRYLISRSKWAPLFVLMSVACGCSHSSVRGQLSNNGAVTVNVSEDASIEETTETVLATVADGANSCTIYWGNLDQGPHGAHPLYLIVGKDTVIEGWLLCVTLLPEPFDVHPGARQTRLLSWGKGQLIAGQPNGQTIFLDDLADLKEGWSGSLPAAFAMFDVEGSSLETPIRDLAPTLKALPSGFVFIEWMIERTTP